MSEKKIIFTDEKIKKSNILIIYLKAFSTFVASDVSIFCH